MMRWLTCIGLSGLCIILLSGNPAFGGITIRVPQNYPKIQDALLWATHGDVVVVSPGVYVENINFLGKNVVLCNLNPHNPATVAATVIDGNKKGPVVTFDGSETSGCVLSGFTIRNGLASNSGGGIYGTNTKARIEHNVIVANEADYGYGGGLSHCDGTIQNNIISGNTGGYYGGADVPGDFFAEGIEGAGFRASFFVKNVATKIFDICSFCA